MVLSSGPIVTMSQEIAFTKYAIINYGGKPLISRTKRIAMVLSERGVSAFQDIANHKVWVSLYFNVVDMCSAFDHPHSRKCLQIWNAFIISNIDA